MAIRFFYTLLILILILIVILIHILILISSNSSRYISFLSIILSYFFTFAKNNSVSVCSGESVAHFYLNDMNFTVSVFHDMLNVGKHLPETFTNNQLNLCDFNWMQFCWLRISVPQMKSTEREQRDQLLRNLRCADTEMDEMQRLQAHSRNLSSSSRPSRTQGISACPPLQLQHHFLCVFYAEEKWPIFIFSTWQNGPSFTSEIPTSDFCHPCIKNQLQATTTLTTFSSVKVFGGFFFAEWRASLNDTSIAASASFTAFANNNCCCWKPAFNLFTTGFCQMEVRGQTFVRFGDVFPAFPDSSASPRTFSLINTDHRII